MESKPLRLIVGLTLVLFSTCIVGRIARAQEEGSLASATGNILTNDDILKMVEAELSDAVIVAKIKSSATQFDTSTTALIQLKEAGVSDAVMQAMTETGIPQEQPAPESTATNVLEPEFVGVVFRLGVGGELQPLERVKPVYKSKVRFMGYGGVNSTMEVKGGRSSVRIKAGESMEFVVRGYAPQMDPNSMVQLIPLKASKDKRELETAKLRAFTSSTMDPTSGALPVNAVRYGTTSIKFTPASPLAPGEYAIRSGSMMDMFCFGVDQDSNK